MPARETASTAEPEAVSAYRRSLPEGELIDFAYTGLDRLGVPTYSAALWPASGAFCNGLGYGTTEEEAMIGAFGELSEVAAAHTTLPKMPRTRASYAELAREYGERSILDPVEACLEAGSDYRPDAPLDWVEARRHPTGETVLVPVEHAASRFADLRDEERARKPLIVPITNGLGAGPTFEMALSHAVLELLQRDGNSVSYRALDEGVAVDTSSVSDPETRRILDHLDASGVDVAVKLAAADFGMANLYVVGADRDPAAAPHPISLSACGEAASPDRGKALRKALLEYAAARARKLFNHGPLGKVAAVAPPGYLERFREAPLGSEEDRSLEAMLDWLSLSPQEMKELLEDPVLSERARVGFSELPHSPLPSGDRKALLDLVADRLAGSGFEVLYVDLSPQGENGEVRAVHALVPGLEVETVSYGRLGARNLKRLLDRGSSLVRTGKEPEGGARILLTEEREAELGPAWLDRGALERTVGRLYPLYREPGRHVAALEAERRRLL
jgi:YcaO-like protein with predicted kinase domain